MTGISHLLPWSAVVADLIAVALGPASADLVIRNCAWVSVHSREVIEGADVTEDCSCRLNDACMQHSLLAPAVIPSLRISGLGLIDVDRFDKTDLLLPT